MTVEQLRERYQQAKEFAEENGWDHAHYVDALEEILEELLVKFTGVTND